MLNKKFWQEALATQSAFDVNRRVIIGQAADALHLSKQAIFALHRADLKEAQEKLDLARQILAALEKQHGGDHLLLDEGSWKAAFEEFVEASLFNAYCNGKEIGEIEGLSIGAEQYIGGLSDLCGEIVRHMVGLTVDKKFDEVMKAREVIVDIIHELMQANLTGYLRTKFDQAKRHWQKAEEIVYDISIRR
ncbi:MAG: hypothetical protein V1763_02535 [Parcubacteria group bacterium]